MLETPSPLSLAARCDEPKMALVLGLPLGAVPPQAFLRTRLLKSLVAGHILGYLWPRVSTFIATAVLQLRIFVARVPFIAFSPSAYRGWGEYAIRENFHWNSLSRTG